MFAHWLDSLRPSAGRDDSESESAPPRVLAWARLDNCNDLGSELGWDQARISQASAEEFILGAWVKWGPEVPSRLSGDFAFAVLDGARVFAARDALGVRPLFYAASPLGVGVGTSVRAFHQFSGVDCSPSEEWLASYVAGTSWHSRQTAAAGVRKLLPGEAVLLEAGRETTWRWHRFNDSPSSEELPDPRWVTQYQDSLYKAVSLRTPLSERFGVESSGGLDCSSIIAVVASQFPDRAPNMHTFARGMIPEVLRASMLTSVKYGLANNHLRAGPVGGSVDLGRDWQVLGHPAEDYVSLLHTPFYALAGELDIHVLLSGFGGDEGVTHHGSQVPSSPRRAGLPARVRAQMKSFSRTNARAPSPVVRKDPGPSGILVPGFSSDPTQEHLEGGSALNAPVLAGLRQVGTRASECSLIAASYGVEYRFPLLDAQLIQLYLNSPAPWRRHDGMGRYLHRQAVAEILPAEVAWRRSKNLGQQVSKPTAVTSTPQGQVGYMETEHAIKLRAGIHPTLEFLVRPEGLRRAVEQDAFNLDPGSRRILRRLGLLNDWLTHDHP